MVGLVLVMLFKLLLDCYKIYTYQNCLAALARNSILLDIVIRASL